MESYKIDVIRFGYVGFPLACLFARKYPTVGYDSYQERVVRLFEGADATNEISTEVTQVRLNTHLRYTTTPSGLRDCNTCIVAVPIPIDLHQQPDLTALREANSTIGSLLKQGDIIIYELTVYPGVAEEICVPTLEQTAGLTSNRDFYVGYSPEHINPGDKRHMIENICKIASGSTPEIAREMDALYDSVLIGGTYFTSSTKVVEVVKMVENAQHGMSIVFMDEIAKIFSTLGIDTNAVIDAASSKWNFLPFRSRLVGGYCIGVDLCYLIQKTKLHRVSPRLVMEARKTNDSMGGYTAYQIINRLCLRGLPVEDSRVLLLSLTFKENCPDTRNTKVIDIHRTLQHSTDNITAYDPLANAERVAGGCGLTLTAELAQLPTDNDVVMLCMSHQRILQTDVCQYLKPKGVIYDVKGRLSLSEYIYRL